MGPKTVTLSTPSTRAAPAAGSTKRQAEMPAARMAINSLRRFSPTKAARVPNRKTKGSNWMMTLGDFNSTRPKMRALDSSPDEFSPRDTSTKSINITRAEMMARATARARSCWARTYRSMRPRRTLMRTSP
ncbi:hypothetical protein D3C80_1268670 [compost metagenome]